MRVAGALVSTVEWKSDDFEGREICRGSRLDSGWELAGEFHGVELGEKYTRDDTVQMDDEWRTRLLRVKCASQMSKVRPCTLSATPDGVWKQKTGDTIPDLCDIEGSSLVDLELTPGLRIVTRTGETSYRCGDNYLGVTDELTFSVDEFGLVTDDEMGMNHVVI